MPFCYRAIKCVSQGHKLTKSVKIRNVENGNQITTNRKRSDADGVDQPLSTANGGKLGPSRKRELKWEDLLDLGTSEYLTHAEYSRFATKVRPEGFLDVPLQKVKNLTLGALNLNR